jgi:exopolysaccharide production protein ExoQ
VSPHAATAVCCLAIIGLFWLERDPKSRTSPALWLAVVWIALGASRGISSWTGSVQVVSAETYLEGSPLDRAFLSGLLLAALAVLAARWSRTAAVLRRNPILVMFVAYCAISTLWSDFPFVAFKRFLKFLGNVAMVLLVFTDPAPARALRRLFARCAFLLVPFSVLLIKYYPELGRIYDRWIGTAYYTGVAADKNTLGCACLVLGLATLWRFVEAFRDPSMRIERLLAHGTVLGMVLWLFGKADSVTSLSCFALGGAAIVLVNVPRLSRPATIHMVASLVLVSGIMIYMLPDAYASLVEGMGRNTTLTGRTDLWDDLLALASNPWFGAGFESFFLGERLDQLWSKYWWHPNEAHNGYLEIYLNLGLTGVAMLLLMLVAGYRNVITEFRANRATGTLRLALIVVAPIYNLTEAAFRVVNPLWFAFLLVTTAGLPIAGAEHAVDRQSETPPALPRRNAPRPWQKTLPGSPRQGSVSRRSIPSSLTDRSTES